MRVGFSGRARGRFRVPPGTRPVRYRRRLAVGSLVRVETTEPYDLAATTGLAPITAAAGVLARRVEVEGVRNTRVAGS